MQNALSPYYAQGSLLSPREPLAFRNPDARGRVVQALPGQSFWVTSPEYIQKRDGVVGVARSGKNAACAYFFPLADMEKYFQRIGE